MQMEDSKKNILADLKDNWIKAVKNTGFSKDPKEVAFIHAINKNNYQKVAGLIKEGVNPNLEYSGNTALNIAISKNAFDVVNLLIKNGADINKPSENHGGIRPIDAAITHSNPDIIRLLIANNVDFSGKNSKKSLIQEAIEKQKTEALQALLEAGIDPYQDLVKDTGPMALAIRYNSLNSLKILLKYKNIVKNINTELREENNQPLLHFAISKGNNEAVSALIDAGFNINKRDAKGQTPLHYAISQGNHEIVEKLIENGADVNKNYDLKGDTPLHVAIRRGISWKLILPVLVEEKIDINAQNNNKETALMIALKGPGLNAELVDYLLENGANPNIQDKDYNVPVLVASTRSSDITKSLLKCDDIDLNARSMRTGETIIYSVIRDRDHRLFEDLINRGARIDIVNNNEKSPLRIARELRDNALISRMEKLLLNRKPSNQFKR